MSLQGSTETDTNRGLWEKNSGRSKTKLNSVLGSCDHTIVTSHYLFIITYNPGFSLNANALNSHKEISLFGEGKKIKYIFLDSWWEGEGEVEESRVRRVMGLFSCLTQCNKNLHNAEMEGMKLRLQNGCAELNSENIFTMKTAGFQQELASCIK